MRESAVKAEFSDFVASHWARLVRAAVLLGCSPTEAEDVVQSALTRCLLSWARVRRADDRDAYVHRVLVNTFVDSRRSLSSRELPATHVPDHVLADDRIVVFGGFRTVPGQVSFGGEEVVPTSDTWVFPLS